MKIFYSIGEVAEMLDVPVSTVRFWETRFDVLRPEKGASGHRRFTVGDVENLKAIYHLVREKGMTLDGARRRLKESPAGIARDQEIADRLLGVRAVLEELRQELLDEPGEVYHAPEPVPVVEPGSESKSEPVARPSITEQTLF